MKKIPAAVIFCSCVRLNNNLQGKQVKCEQLKDSEFCVFLFLVRAFDEATFVIHCCLGIWNLLNLVVFCLFVLCIYFYDVLFFIVSRLVLNSNKNSELFNS